MSKLGPIKKTVLLMDLYEALKQGDRLEVEQLQATINASDSQVAIEEMNKLLSSEKEVETTVKDKILSLSQRITEQEEYDIAKGLIEVYTKIPKYFRSEKVLKGLIRKVEAFSQSKQAEKGAGERERREKKVPLWQRAVISVMGKLGMGQEKYTHKKVQQASHVVRKESESVFSSDQQS